MRPTLLFMTDEKRRARPAVPYGDTAKAVADNVKRLRERRNMTIYSLSGALGKVGRPITPSAVAKIERQQRQVTVDDLTALAVVFGVSPAALLLPLNDRPGARIPVTGGGEVDAADAWDWAEGRRPLKVSERGEQTELLEFLVNGVPRERRLLRQHPAGRALAAVQQDVEALATRSRYVADNDTDEVEELAERARVSAARLSAEIDRIAVENESTRRGSVNHG